MQQSSCESRETGPRRSGQRPQHVGACGVLAFGSDSTFTQSNPATTQETPSAVTV